MSDNTLSRLTKDTLGHCVTQKTDPYQLLQRFPLLRYPSRAWTAVRVSCLKPYQFSWTSGREFNVRHDPRDDYLCSSRAGSDETGKKKVGSAINGDDLIRSIRVRRSNTCHLVCALTLRIMAIFEKCPAGLKARVR